MTDAKSGDGHEPTLDDKLFQFTAASVNASSDISSSLDHAHVVMKDKAPDIGATINHIRQGAKPLLGQYHLDQEDASLIPGYEDLQRISKALDNLVKDGQLRKEAKDQYVNMFRQQIERKAVERYQSELSAIEVGEARTVATTMAKAAGMYSLVEQIKKADTARDVASISTPAFQRMYQETEQYRATKGTLDGFKPYKAQAPHGSGHN